MLNVYYSMQITRLPFYNTFYGLELYQNCLKTKKSERRSPVVIKLESSGNRSISPVVDVC